MRSQTHVLSTNRLLASLPKENQQRLATLGESIELTFSEVLTESGEKVRHVYFPTSSFISLITSREERSGLEVGLIGDEGMLGSSLVLGVDSAPLYALVQGAGTALRIEATPFNKELKRDPDLNQMLKRYIYVQMRQLAQTSVCTRFHVVEARLARWLLMTQDRAHIDHFHVTHEFLAYMLGVRRVGVTKAANSLQNQQLISYNRGNLIVRNRIGLIAAACECYQMDLQSYTQTMRF